MGWFSDRWNDVKSAASTVKDAASGIVESAKSAVTRSKVRKLSGNAASGSRAMPLFFGPISA